MPWIINIVVLKCGLWLTEMFLHNTQVSEGRMVYVAAVAIHSQTLLYTVRYWEYKSEYQICRYEPEEEPSVDISPESHDQAQKVPLRILERRIQSLTQTTIPHDLNRLRQHKENIILYHRECNWTRLNIEQVNASRTVQVIYSFNTCSVTNIPALDL